MVERLRRTPRCGSGSPRARRVRTELPFAFTLGPPGAGGRSLLVDGVVDVHATEDDGTLVVDYKSDPLDGRDPGELVADGLRHPAADLRAGRAARRAQSGSRWRTASSSAPTSRRWRRYEAGDAPAARRGAARAAGRAGGGRLRACRRAAPRPLRRLPRPRRALQLGPRAHVALSPLRSFRQERVLLCDSSQQCNPEETDSRCLSASSSHRKRSGSSPRASAARPAASCSGRSCGLGRRDPRRRAAGALRQGGR